MTLYNAAVPATTWTNTVVLNSQPITTQQVWKDDRTGLYWTENKGVMDNSFTIANCGFFNNTVPRGTHWSGSAGCGVAINYCKDLQQVAVAGGPIKDNWYLPTRFELEQAFKDNMYNNAGTTLANANAFTTGNWFWSSSEYSGDSTNAWHVELAGGNTARLNGKATVRSVRCVLRD